MKLDTIFNEVAIQMRADFDKARGAVHHAGLKGNIFEEIFRRFLRDYLPQRLDISSGLIVDSNGKASRQLDVIISDMAQTPIFFRSGEVRVIPVECVYAVIEVKANLDSNELERVFKNMKSVRRLEKKAFFKRYDPLGYSHMIYGKKWEIWPVHYFVFAFESINLISLAELIDKKHREESLPEWSRIDSVCVLDKGVICNKHPNGHQQALPEPGSTLYYYNGPHPLMAFYALISEPLNQAELLPKFRFNEYFDHIKLSGAA